jgi:hypothetical protein
MTAVEWLVEKLNNKIDYIPIKHWDSLREIIQQALEMEKEQIINAHLTGLVYPLEIEATKQAEQYYNDTFGDGV